MTDQVKIKLTRATVHQSTDRWIPKLYVGDRCFDEGNASIEGGGVKAIPAGEPFEVDAAEAARLLCRFEGEIISENPPAAVIAAKQEFEEHHPHTNKPTAEPFALDR